MRACCPLLAAVIIFGTPPMYARQDASSRPPAPESPVAPLAVRQVSPPSPMQSAAASVRIFVLKHVDASELIGMLDKVMPRDTPPAPGAVAANVLKLVADPNTNSIVAVGPDAALELTARLVAELDVPPTAKPVPKVGPNRAGAPPVDGKPRAQPAPARPQDSAPRDDGPVRVDITVFEVTVPADKADLLEAEALEDVAATPAELAIALNQVGPTRLLYRIDRTMTFSRPVETEISANVPYATGPAAPAGSPKSRAFNREEVGAQFKFSGEWIEDSNRGSARFQMVSTLSGMAAAPDANLDAPLYEMRRIRAGFDGVVTLGKPAVTLTIDAAPGGRPAGVAYVIRILLSAPH